MAPMAASIRPSPIADSSMGSTPFRSRTVARGSWLVPPATTSDSNTNTSFSAWPISSDTMAWRSWSVSWILRSARSLNQADAELLQRIGERMPARMLAQDDPVALQADLEGIHDLVGGPIGQHTVLVDPRFVGERRRADHRLVRLHRVAGGHRDQAGGPHDLLRVQPVADAQSPA